MSKYSGKIAAVAVALLLVSACSAPQTDDSAQDQTQDQTASPTVEQSQGEGQQDQDSDAHDGPEDQTLTMDDAVAQISYPLTEGSGSMTMGLHAPIVDGDTMLVQVTFSAYFDNPNDDSEYFNRLHGVAGWNMLAPIVHDRANMKSYFVPRTKGVDNEGGGWLSSGQSKASWGSEMGRTQITHGEEYTMWSYFPAPEDDIEVVDVSVVPGVQEFKDIELEFVD